MKAILKSDLLTLRMLAKSYAIVFAMMLLFTFIMKNTAFLAFYPAFMTVMLPNTLAASTEQSGWESCLLTMPVRPEWVVRSRYLIILLFGTASAFVGFVLSLFVPQDDRAAGIIALLVALLIPLVINSIVLPCIYRFGLQKARIIMIVLICVPSLLIPTLQIFSFGEPPALLFEPWFYAALFAGSLVLYFLSSLVSTTIYRHMEH